MDVAAVLDEFFDDDEAIIAAIQQFLNLAAAVCDEFFGRGTYFLNS